MKNLSKTEVKELLTSVEVLTDLNKVNKTDLIDMIKEYEETLVCLEEKLCKTKKYKPGRKDQVLEILKAGPITVGAIATRIGISARNVSSQLTYLRKDGHDIATSSTGKKFLM